VSTRVHPWFRFSPGVLVPLLLAACGAPSSESPPPPPRIDFDTLVHSFGTVEHGARLAHTFSFSNRGGADLTVDKLRTGCGCTATVEAERFTPPGGGGRILVECDTSAFFGRQRRTVSIYSNDPAAPVTVLRLVGEVLADAAVVPAPLYVGRIHRGRRAARDVKLYTRDEFTGVDVLPAEASPVDVSVEPTQESGCAALAIVTATDAPLGPFSVRLRVYAANAREPLREVIIVGEVAPDLEVSPARIKLPPGAGGAYLLVDNRGARPTRVTGASWHPALGSVEVEAIDPGTRYRLRLKPEQPLAVDVADSVVIVRTDHPEQPAIEVPVSIEAAVDAASRK
jgi:hypothetical protein